MRDGQKVSYIGPDDEGLTLGDVGQLISGGTRSSHVMWSTGVRSGLMMLVDNQDLAPAGRSITALADDGLDDSLDVGSLDVTAARDVFDMEGEAGLLSVMAEQGHLSSFSSIAEEAVTLVSTRIRNDPSFRAVAAHLDDEEADRLVSLATVVLVRDAFDLGE